MIHDELYVFIYMSSCRRENRLGDEGDRMSEIWDEWGFDAAAGCN